MYIANLFAFVLYPNCSLFLAVRSGDAHRLAAGDAYAGAQGDGRRDLAAEGRAAQQEQDARAAGVAAEGADGLRRPQTPVRVSEIFKGLPYMTSTVHIQDSQMNGFYGQRGRG